MNAKTPSHLSTIAATSSSSAEKRSVTTRLQIRTSVRAGEMGAVSQASQRDCSNYYANVGSYIANSAYE